MDLGYADEKLVGAVDTLATGRGRICERLAVAWTAHLGHVKPETFPDVERAEFARIRDEIVVGLNQGVLSLSEEKAVQVAEQIVHLQHAIARQLVGDE